MIDRDELIRASDASILASVRDDGTFFPSPHIRDLALSAVRAAGGPLAATLTHHAGPDVANVAASRAISLPVR